MAAKDSTSRAGYQKAWRDAHKESRKAYAAAYYAANKERMSADMAAHYRENAETYKARARKWERENWERKLERARGYYAANPAKYKEAGRIHWQKHKAKRNAAKAAYRAKFPDLAVHHVRLRQTRKQKATPVWANLEAVKAFYKQAAELTRQTGIRHHVDHFVPLKHPLVSGLHNEFNLRVIPAADNQSKGNSFEV